MNVKRLSVPIFVVFVFVLCTLVSAVGAADCTCGDICVNTTGWWRAGGTFNASETPIQAAVDTATEGDTICVKDGTYTENVNVAKQLTIRSENGSDSTIVAAASNTTHVFNVATDYVNISGFTVKGADYRECAGISLNNAEYCNISGNNASENTQGISLFDSNNNTITNNKVSENSDFGIALVSSISNTITNNYASHTNGAGISLSKNSRSNTVTGNNASYNFGTGIALANSGNNTLRDNVMFDNDYNFYADGVSYSELDNDIDLSNLVDGKPIYYLVEASDTVIDSATNAGTVYCIHCDNVTVKDLTLERNSFGIFFYNTSNTRIENNNIGSCDVGIALVSSSNNSITGNDGTGGNSIGLWESSGNTIEGNNACYGMNNPNIYLEGSDYNVITGNNASVGYEGIILVGSAYNTITNNIASNNYGGGGKGIILEDSSSNTLINNTMDGNGQNFYIDGRDILHFIQDIDMSNTVDGRPIYYLVNQQNQQVPDAAGFVGIVNSRNITVSDTTNYEGILFANATNSRIENVNASILGTYGIRLFFSSDNTLSNNTVSNDQIVYSFFLETSSNNSISNNIVSAKSYPGVGFVLETSSNNSISNNSVSNSGTGFVLQEGSDSNTITNNTASNMSDLDFFSHASYSNKITDLTICSYPTTISFIYDAGIEIKSVTNPEQEDPAGKANIGKYVDVKDITVDSWILLNVSYNDADVTNVEEASLRLYRSTDTDWVEIEGSGVNTVENYVYANVTDIGQIAAFGNPKTLEATIYVPDNYTTIQAAVDNVSAGGTIIVRDGMYIENVNVDKRLTIRSENGSDSTIVDAADSSHNVFKVTADYVTISGFTVTGATKDLDTSGIYLSDADYCNISDIKASNNGAGIFLFNSSNNTIKNNAVNSNEWTGIYVEFSSNNTITSNIASTNGKGIVLGRFTSSNIVTNNTASNNHDGIRLYSSGNNKLTNNNASNNNCGIYLFHSSNNTFSGNTALNNTDVDFSDEGSRDNSIADFTISRYPTTISFIYEHGIGIKSVTVPEPDPAGKANIGKYVDVTNATEDSWILLNVSYSDADVTNVKEDSLRLYRWTGTNWAEIAGSGVNTAENYVYANVTSFSQIAVFGDPKTPEATIYVPDNYTTIQAAVDNASAGGTIIVRDGTYTENVNVDKRVTIRSENGSDSTIVDAADSGDHAFDVSTDYVNISGFTVKGATLCSATVTGYAGIYLGNVGQCNISNNNASNNCYGIILESSRNNTITSNNVIHNSYFGITLLDYSRNNTITNNNASYNWLGIGLFDNSNSNTLTGNNATYNLGGIDALGIGLYKSGNNTLRNNRMSANMYNFEVEGESYSELDNDIDTSNLVDGKPIYYLVDASDTVIDSATNAGTVYCIHCDNVTVKDLDLTKNGDGIHFYNTSNSRIENNSIYQCFEGFRLWSSSNNIITGNSVRHVGYGIVLWMSSGNTITANNAYNSMDYPLIGLDRSDNNTVTNNNVNNGYSGVLVQYSSNSTIANNTVSNTYVQDGITLQESDNNVITGNNVSNSLKDGICLEGSSNNTISGNTATSNKEYGICLDFSSDNLIYNNYFENTNNSYDDGDNTWNITKTEGTNIISGPYLGGNYWSDYAGEDLDGDGLGDTMLPYNCSGDIQTGGDYLPLVSTGEVLPVHNLDTGKNFSTIQAAIYDSDTLDGHAITVDPGTYTENVKVNKSLTVGSTTGNPADTIVQAANSSDNIFNVTADNVTINGFSVKGADGDDYVYGGIYLYLADYCDITNNNCSKNFYVGILIEKSNNNSIANNICSANYYDIYLGESSNNSIENNTCTTNESYGIYLTRSNNNHILNNNCSNHRYGIVLDTCTNNKITNNSCSNNEYGIGLWHASNNKLSGNVMRENGIEIGGFSLTHYTNEIDTSNTVNGKPVYYWNGVEGGKIPGDVGQVILVNCSNVTVENQNLNNASIGIEVAFSSFITIRDNNFAYNWYKGISLEYSSNNSIINNSCSYNHEGIRLRGSSNNSITSNNCPFNSDTGIMLDRWSNENSIANNTCVNNCEHGISLEDSANNSIVNNKVSNNNGRGISLGWNAISNTLTNNIVSNNKNGGILFFHASNNILHNNSVTANSADGFLMERWSNNNSLTDNTALNNTHYDFNSDETSRDNVIEYFTISSTTISFIYEHGIGIKSVTVPEPDPAGKANIGKYVDATNETGDSWILLNVSYSDADVTNVEEASLRLYRWTDTDWAEIEGSAVNTAENYVYANVTSFSQIAVFGDSTIKPTPAPTPAPRRGGGGGGSSGPCDTDGDGYGDIDELIMGTDPYDPCDPNPTCVACLASIGGRVLPKPAVKPQATPRLVSTPEPVHVPTSRPAPTPVPEPEKPGIPCFEAVFAVAGLLAVAYLMRRKKK